MAFFKILSFLMLVLLFPLSCDDQQAVSGTRSFGNGAPRSNQGMVIPTADKQSNNNQAEANQTETPPESPGNDTPSDTGTSTDNATNSTTDTTETPVSEAATSDNGVCKTDEERGCIDPISGNRRSERDGEGDNKSIVGTSAYWLEFPIKLYQGPKSEQVEFTNENVNTKLWSCDVSVEECCKEKVIAWGCQYGVQCTFAFAPAIESCSGEYCVYNKDFVMHAKPTIDEEIYQSEQGTIKPLCRLPD